MKKKSMLLLAALSAFIITSCEKEEEKTSNPLPANLHGVFVVNEGAFGQGNASISFASSDSAYYNNDIYTEANGIPAGDLLQSFTIHQSKGYLVPYVLPQQSQVALSCQNYNFAQECQGNLQSRQNPQ